MTLELLKEKSEETGISFNLDLILYDFEKAMVAHQDLSRTASAGMFK